MRVGESIYYALVALGVLAASGAAFWLTFIRYEMLENKIRDGISDYAASLYDLFDRMFKRKTMNQCYLIILISTIVAGLIGFVIGIQVNFMLAILFSLLLGLLGFRLPGILVRFLFNRRVAKFDAQLIDALNMMSNAIKSGLSFMQVVQLLERELPNPASQEFAMALKENRVGINLNDALLNMVKRVPSDDLFMIINSVVTLSQQGGDLSEAFDTIANTIRERQRVSQKIRTLAQAGITQATILSSLPLVMLAIMYAVQPEYVELLFTTQLGIGMLVFMVVLMGIGMLWMKKLLTIDI